MEHAGQLQSPIHHVRRGLVTTMLAVGLLATGCGGDDSGKGDKGPSRNATPIPAASGTNDAVMAATTDDPQLPASSALAAVTSYLDAEVAADFASSWAVLSADDRTDVGSLTAWNEQHSVLPRTTFFSVIDDGSGGGPIVTDVTFDPRVDETVGVVAGSARITWAVIEEGGGFTIDRTATKVEADYPEDTLAAADVDTWLARIRDAQPTIGYDGTLLGQPALVDQLQQADDSFRATDTIRLDDWATPELVTNAFGPGASEWARVVHLDGPVPFDAVVAPYGDRWVVVGVVAT